jgi:4'-phosphopantetheinyl transferase
MTEKTNAAMSLIAADGSFADTMPLAAIAPPALRDGDVHVWFAHFGPEDPAAAEFHALLDTGERSRADRFVFPHHRERFVRAHGVLRRVLAAYTDLHPAALAFIAGHYGKPALVGHRGVEFSLSHAGDGVAIAVTVGHEIGIDIETPRVMNDRDDLVRRYFSSSEIAAYEATALPRRDQAFFRLWTRKEAFVKGIGLGLGRPLDSFTVGLGIPVHLDAPGDTDWSLHHLDPGAGFVGAVACRHPMPVLYGWRLNLAIG